jgi:outer membrane scaffolding protein for murein synthesis (MipA/OmpV family)
LLQFPIQSKDKIMSTLRVTFAACCAALSTLAVAQGPAGSAPPLWELGGVALGVSQSAYPGADQQVNRALALPYFVYRGDVLRADRDTAGIRAMKTETFELDVGFAGAFGAGTETIEARQGMRKLGTMVELGPRLKWDLGAGPAGGRLSAEFPARAVLDLSDKAAHRGWSLEPKLTYSNRTASGWRYSASVSAIVADTRLAQTFYEVRSSEATAARPAYRAEGGLVSWRFGTAFSRSLARDWNLFGFARLETVAGAANESSPLVRRSSGASVGVGVAYTWMRSDRAAFD